MSSLDARRAAIREARLAPEAHVLDALAPDAPSEAIRRAAATRGAALVRAIREDDRPGLMELFLAEYGLSTEEGVALMCLAEALLRVPDAETVDALIEDKIAPSAWGEHLGRSSSSLVNASTWALMLTGKVLRDGEGTASVLRGAVRRLGEPAIRVAVGRAMREMGRQFVLGQTVEEALRRGRPMEARGYTYSYDMLGEAALTAQDADAYRAAYADAVARLAGHCRSGDVRANPGVSVKLSALHPRYEEAQRARVMEELVPRLAALARDAARAGMGLNVDAEEADRLDLSLDVIEAVLHDPALAGWDGFGVVVQAYSKRAGPVIDWLHNLARAHDRRLMVRLVKGAYWDGEIKRAQVEGLAGFPVFARKAATDVSFLSCAGRLLGMTDRLYPQLATHNAHTVAAILEMAADRDVPEGAFEFQRLHGMGEALHDQVLAGNRTRHRIYAPVGAHRDLLAYLVRRLLENGANSSFVNQVVDASVPPERVAADPFAALEAAGPSRAVVAPPELYAPERANSRGWNVQDPADLAEIEAARAPFRDARWEAGPLLVGEADPGERRDVTNPAWPGDVVGEVAYASGRDVETALAAARPWDAPAEERAAVLVRASELLEARFGEVFALLAREAGKGIPDAVAELREAVDFLRYYAARGREADGPPRGVLACVSPWNFPLAIFTGQVAAALAAGNGVVAKPAEATNLIAHLATRLMHEAGVPRHALQLLPGEGSTVGAALSRDPRLAGVIFTGSTATAKAIDRAMAEAMDPAAPLVAETGGLNAMVVDSTALPEQAVRDVVASAFRSAGQRCSALRMLYVQEDVAEPVLRMLRGAMDELRLGDPWATATDVGPVIDAAARDRIERHVETARAEGRLLHRLDAPAEGSFVGPALIRVGGIEDLEEEVFGPVLHVATYRAEALGRVVDAVNASGYGLTFGIHSRIDDRVERVASRIACGNVYVNRNQIGAVVGTQPFGGEGLSGTGPKAGGPRYVARLVRPGRPARVFVPGPAVDSSEAQRLLDAARPAGAPLGVATMPGPTGESNRLTLLGRGVVLCLGPDAEAAEAQATLARESGCAAVRIAPGAGGPSSLDGVLPRGALATLRGVDVVALWGEGEDLRAARRALAAREGKIVPLLAEDDLAERCRIERHLCIDTTASGGNATLLAEAG